MKSTIQSLVTDRGFGFILSEKGGIFFHASDVQEPFTFDELEVGQTVDFEPEETEKGMQGRNVRRVDV